MINLFDYNGINRSQLIIANTEKRIYKISDKKLLL